MNTVPVSGDKFGHDPEPRLKRRLLLKAQAALYWCGVARVYSWIRRDHPLTILMYHSVARDADARWIAPRNRMAPAQFERQMCFLARHRRVIAIDELLNLIDNRRPLLPGTIVLTFDDGYKDNLEVVAPILQRYRLPAVLYLATAYIRDGENQWADQLYSAIRHRRKDQLRLGDDRVFDLSQDAGRQKAYQALASQMLVADRRQRSTMLKAIMDQLQPENEPARQTLIWDEVQKLNRQFPRITLGVHTADHLDLTAMDANNALVEIRRSIDHFKTAMGYPPRHFSFPFSRPVKEVCRRLVELDIRSVMTSEGALYRHNIKPIDLRRYEAPRDQSMLRYYTSGAHPGLSLSLFGRA